MRQQIHRLLIIPLLCNILLAENVLLSQSDAAPLKQFSLPAKIKLEMFALRGDGTINYETYDDPHCSQADLPDNSQETRFAYGCTWYDGSHGDMTKKLYPFNSYEIEIGYQSEIIAGYQQGYLSNVVPKEVAITVSSQGNKPLSCVKTQAVASRTFAYNQTYNAGNPANTLRINNSNQKQVYVPFYYAGLTSAQRQRVDEAVSEVLYMTTPDSTLPIRAHFGADNDSTTTDGGESYLKSVYDPISQLGTDKGTGNGGMSAMGCSRWSFGHTSSRGPVAFGDSNYPHDNQGDGDFWSVRYDSASHPVGDNAAQILSQYYTEMVLRNASGQIVTPAWRWNPLLVDWGNGSFTPPPMQANHTYNVVIQLHNSGIETWTNDTLLS